MSYSCPRCGSKFNKSSMKNHLLNRKNLCKPLIKDIDKDECINILFGPPRDNISNSKDKNIVSNNKPKSINKYSLNGENFKEEQKDQIDKKVDILVKNSLAIIPKKLYDALNKRSATDHSTIDNNFNVYLLPDRSTGPDHNGYDQPEGTIRTRYIYQTGDREFLIYLTYRSRLSMVEQLASKPTEELIDTNAPPPITLDISKYIKFTKDRFRKEIVNGDTKSKILHQIREHIDYLAIKDKLGHLSLLDPDSINSELEKREYEMALLFHKSSLYYEHIPISIMNE